MLLLLNSMVLIRTTVQEGEVEALGLIEISSQDMMVWSDQAKLDISETPVQVVLGVELIILFEEQIELA